jgi:hypothetical protein
VPQGDFSNTKTILGTVDKLGEDYVTTINVADSYDYIGANCLDAEAEAASFGLCSYKT